MLKNKRGQSTLEYIILVTAVVAVLLVFLGPNGVFRAGFTNALSSGTNGMQNMAVRINASRFCQGAGCTGQ